MLKYYIQTYDHSLHAQEIDFNDIRIILQALPAINLLKVAIQNENIFDKLKEVTKVCSLVQITEVLFKVGGQYRRNS